MIFMNLTCLAIAGACIWIVILLLPWRPWATAEFLDAAPNFSEEDLSDITVLIPARNEAGVIETTLSGLKAQGDGLNFILVDDQSVDGTARAAKASAMKNLRVVSGTPPKRAGAANSGPLNRVSDMLIRSCCSFSMPTLNSNRVSFRRFGKRCVKMVSN